MPGQSQEAPVGTLSHVLALSLALGRASIDPLRPRCEGPLRVCGWAPPHPLGGPSAPMWPSVGHNTVSAGDWPLNRCFQSHNASLPKGGNRI